MVTTVKTPRPGSPRAAFGHRPFRWMFCGAFASNIGTWMQNIVLISFADALTSSATFVGLITFAQLGPMLFLSPFGGVIADRFNRRTLMIGSALVQASFSIMLAGIASVEDPSKVLLVLCVAGIGIASAINSPAAQATLPALVGKVDLPGAVALNSAQLNASRVVGPLLAVLPFLDSAPTVFLINAATYAFVIVALLVVRFDGRPAAKPTTANPFRNVAEGISAARRDVVIGRSLLTVGIYSLCSLVFIYQMKGFARVDLGLREDRFGLLFSSFGIGAVLGAILVGTVLSTHPRTTVAQYGLAGFAISLGIFSMLTSPLFAFPTVAACGFFYFVVITSFSTIVQEEVDDQVRGRVMGLWMMVWAGLVPVGSLIAGLLIDHVGHPPVLAFGAIVALGLAFYTRAGIAAAKTNHRQHHG